MRRNVSRGAGHPPDSYVDLSLEQARQLVDVEQVYAAYRAADRTDRLRFAGAMSWKTVRGRQYLYRKRRGVWKSLGPRDERTERAYAGFHEGRDRIRDRLAGLAQRLDGMAPVNRALRLGRVPAVLARALRAFDRNGLLGTTIKVVGTNALYGYERLAAVRIASAHLATDDADLLLDTRSRLHLLAGEGESDTVLGLLRKADRSFELAGPESFRAVNRDGYMVDLIRPMPRNRLSLPWPEAAPGAGDLVPVEIEGLAWLVSSPKIRAIVIDERGYPAPIAVPDPRAFAFHKLWLSRRADRDPVKRSRDEAQGRLVLDLLRTRLPHLRAEDTSLAAVPLAIRDLALSLAAPAPRAAGGRLEPDW